MSASALPDELWRRILEIGIEFYNFNYKDLCCLSITCRRLNRLSDDDSLWSSLFSADFPQYPIKQHRSSSSVSNKSLYKIRYEKIREQKALAHRRAVLRIQSEINEHSRRIREMELRSAEEKEKMKNTVAEFLNLRKIRQASVALNVWQPEVVRGKQKQIVEQCNVPVNNRIHAIEMELKLCKQQVEGFEKALRVEKRRMQAAKEKLASVEYHPLRDFNLAVTPIAEQAMRKRLRTSSSKETRS
ncbi:F-box protein SKIP24 [Nicotiana tabacum]|uniref:F-box protein SKIP24 n=1 Tax=Nicotiana sylvestris TaxID=4096 RepID=A0A1U7WCA7_NICSY|nr:PREDICTED: F-box protein SKIP24 [Nicotiana sylvestris]